MTAPYDHEALWMKAKLFLNRAMDNDGLRSFDEQALWASLALELLAKAALARVSPLLIAEPTEDGTNILIASGLVKGDARFSSVKASTLFARCQKAFKPFSSDAASSFSNPRNEYIHGPGIGFMALPPHAWWPKYWAQAAILVAALDREIADLVGRDRETTVTDHLYQNTKNVEHQTEARIERARQRLRQYRDGTMSAKVAAEWERQVHLTAGLPYEAPDVCPACEATGLLEGDEIADVEETYERLEEGDERLDAPDPEPTVTLTIDTAYFSCPTCHLTLDRFDYILQAGLPETFTTEGDIDDLYPEPEYGND
ncbi:MAG: hypothetical protein HOW97_14505 [Catenulispora sp.]|nr:hypothetical protein [Catenulispora sp.]